MGYNTGVLILNDAVDQLDKDPNVGKRLREAILYANTNPVSFSIGNHANAGMVVPSKHADDIQILVVGQNLIRRMDTVYHVGWDDDADVRILQQLADRLGYTISKKRAK